MNENDVLPWRLDDVCRVSRINEKEQDCSLIPFKLNIHHQMTKRSFYLQSCVPFSSFQSFWHFVFSFLGFFLQNVSPNTQVHTFVQMSIFSSCIPNIESHDNRDWLKITNDRTLRNRTCLNKFIKNTVLCETRMMSSRTEVSSLFEVTSLNMYAFCELFCQKSMRFLVESSFLSAKTC